MFLFLGASSCASAASWVISSVCLQIDNREVFGDPRSNRNSGELAFSMEKWIKMINIILKYMKILSELPFSCHS